uniref:Uncharacterized protein n=1 Tax=Aegilops tauschii subsp. strangulata TaxID=200361 RepID=A0A453LDQ1_AEGTS
MVGIRSEEIWQQINLRKEYEHHFRRCTPGLSRISGNERFLFKIYLQNQLIGMCMYYRRKRKPSDPFNNLSLTANTIRSWGCGSVTEEWDSLYAQKVQLFTFLSTLPEPALSYGPSVKTNMANSIE